jgi:hypothetical protein
MLGTRPGSALVLALAALVAAAGCTTVGITATGRSSVEQRSLVRSLERAVAHLDTAPLAGRSVAVKLFTLSGDQAFAEELVKTRLEQKGVRLASLGATADVTLKLFATTLSVDTSETLFGLPAMQAPVLAVPIPEIALFKWQRSTGNAEFEVYPYDADGRPLPALASTLGQSRYNRFTILIVISFAVSDLDERPEDQPAPGR